MTFGGRSLPSLGGNSNHAITLIGTPRICDLCDDKFPVGSTFYIWTLRELNISVQLAETMGLHPVAETLMLCKSCDEEENAKAKGFQPGDDTPPIVRSGPQTNVPAKYEPPKYVSKPQCKGHWDQITGPDGYGYLRIASVKGGIGVDVDCDYLLGFDIGWKKLSEPDTTRYNPGKKPAVPKFPGEKAEDRTKWPAMAFVAWGDGSPPDDTILAAAKWVAKEWKAGKNIQFGCFGAHGRTGTFLAMILMINGMADSATDAVTQVRTKFICDDAVETNGQINYLLAMAKDMGMTEPAEPIKGSKGGVIYSGYGQYQPPTGKKDSDLDSKGYPVSTPQHDFSDWGM